MVRILQLFLIALRLSPALCNGNRAAHCRGSLSGDGVCTLLAPEETMQTPGTAMLQAQQHKLSRRHLVESPLAHMKYNTSENSDVWRGRQQVLEHHTAAQKQRRAQHSLGQQQHVVEVHHFSAQHGMLNGTTNETLNSTTVKETSDETLDSTTIKETANETLAKLNSTTVKETADETLDSTTVKETTNETLAKVDSSITSSGGSDVEQGVAVVIPGLGSFERALSVERNIQWVKTQGVPFECWLYVYRTVEELPLDEARFAPCKMIRHPGYWLAHMKEMPLRETTKPWVLHMEESTEVQPDTNLTRIFEIMTANGLGHAAPTFDTVRSPNPYGCEPPCGCCGSLYPILAQQRREGTPGRFVDFIELHIDVFTRSYFSCFQDSIDTSDVNMLHGWGMDQLLPALCGGAVGGSEIDAGRVGLLDHMTMEKVSHGSYSPWEAQQGMTAFLSRHPDTVIASMTTMGDLVLPGEVAKPDVAHSATVAEAVTLPAEAVTTPAEAITTPAEAVTTPL